MKFNSNDYKREWNAKKRSWYSKEDNEYESMLDNERGEILFIVEEEIEA